MYLTIFKNMLTLAVKRLSENVSLKQSVFGQDKILLCMTITLDGPVPKFSVTRKKSPNVYKSCPKMITLEK